MTSTTAEVSERQRLAMGMELLDAGTMTRVRRRVDIVVEAPRIATAFENSSKVPRFLRHESGLYALCYTPSLFRSGVPSVDVRVLPASRYFVARRFRVPIADPALAEFSSDFPTHAQREVLRQSKWRAVVLFPAANYDVVSGSTGLRGKLIRDEKPVCWGRVEALISGQVVGRAHADDRGEFLLLVGALPEPLRAPTLELSVTVNVFAPPAAVGSLPSNPVDRLPLEEVSAGGPSDGVTLGTAVPASYVATVSRVVQCRLGSILTSEIEPFVLN